MFRALSLVALLLPVTALAQVDTRDDTVTAAEVPSAAYGPKVDYAIGYAVDEIVPGSGAWWITEGSHQAMFLTTGEGVVVVDAPPIFGVNIAAAIASVTDEPVTHLVYTHAHADHISGAYQFPAGIEILATEPVAEAVALSNASGRTLPPFGTFVGGQPVPDVTRIVADGETLTVGSQTLRFIELPVSHTHNDLMILIPKHRIAMTVDIVWAGWIPFQALGEAEDIGGYVAAHDAILAEEWDVMVSGHVGRLATREDVKTNRAYVVDLVASVMRALQLVAYQDAAERAGYANPFLTVEVYFDMVAAEAAKDVESRWVGKLGAADVWTYANARAVMMWLRLN